MKYTTLFELTILLISAAFLQSCATVAGGGTGGIGLETNNHIDSLHTTEELPELKRAYVSDSSKAYLFSKEYIKKRLAGNCFALATSFDVDNNAVVQHSNKDCWAACSTMLLKHEAIQMPESLAQELKEKLSNATDLNDEFSIFMNLVSKYKQASYTHPLTTDMLINSLRFNHPLLVGFVEDDHENGHVRIVVGCTFSINENQCSKNEINNCLAFDQFWLIDPADGKIMTMSAGKFKKSAKFGISFYSIQKMSIHVFDWDNDAGTINFLRFE